MRLSPFFLLLTACGGKVAPNVVLDGPTLADCPSSPNCVSSLADPSDEEHYIAPIAGIGTVDEMAAFLHDQKRCEVIQIGESWVRATCTTAMLRFVDDVAWMVDADADVIHVRSSSRVGHSDLGKNRSRVEELRELWESM